MKFLRSIFFVLFIAKAFAEPSHPLFSTAHWGALVVNADTKEIVYSHNASQLFMPASVTKLFTAASALETFGPAHTFQTVLKSTIKPDTAGNIYGDLILVGGGDPSLKSDALKDLAKQIHKLGVRSIQGKVIVDDSLFQDSNLATHAEWEDLLSDDAPEQTALTLNDNIVKVVVSPGKTKKDPTQIQIAQDIPYCCIINHSKTSPEISKPNLRFFREFSDNKVLISGNIPANHPPVSLLISLHEPEEYARRVFLKSLKDLDIPIINSYYPKGTKEPEELARYSSPPLATLLTKMNQTSHNLTAELLFKHIARIKKSNKEVFVPIMEKLAIKPHEYQLYDGSGLSRHNLISPEQTIKLLDYMRKSQVFIQSLSIGGNCGTLKHRFVEASKEYLIQAKTGSYQNVVTLAGYARTQSGKQFLFAFFINNSLYPHAETCQALDHLLIQTIKSK